MSPLWTIWAGAGRPFSWSTTVLGEEGAHKCWLPLQRRVILRDRSWSRDNCLSIILIILMKLFSKTLANKNGKNVKYFFLLPEQKQKQMMQERRLQKASWSINVCFTISWKGNKIICNSCTYVNVLLNVTSWIAQFRMSLWIWGLPFYTSMSKFMHYILSSLFETCGNMYLLSCYAVSKYS